MPASPLPWMMNSPTISQLSSDSHGHGEVPVNRLPLVGEGVRVPWGVDMLPGEVVDVIPPDHVVVSVPLEGIPDEDGATSVRVRVSALEQLTPWRVVKTRPGQPSSGADAVEAWWIDAERGDERARVEVRLSGTAAAMDPEALPDETTQGIRTKGRSAINKFSWRFRLPRVIVLGSTGAFELSDS